jgi:hypothetical protein
MKATGERNDFVSARKHPRHPHCVFVRLSSGVAKENFCYTGRCHLNEFFRRTRANVRIDQV